MGMAELRIGIVGCGRAARIHIGRLRSIEGVRIVGLADADPEAAPRLADELAAGGGGSCPAFTDHRELLASAGPEVLAIFTPHREHYRPAMDSLQAGCHVFIEKPLSTNVQEAADIVGLARGRGLCVGVGHQYRLGPSLVETRRRLAEGAIGPLRLVTAVLAQPWLSTHSGPDDSWRLDPKVSGGGLLCDAGDHLIDALLWTTGRTASEVAAFQDRSEAGLDLVTAAAIRFSDGVPATLALSGVSPNSWFEIVLTGEAGRMRATDEALFLQTGTGPERSIPLAPPPSPSIDADFVAAVRGGTPPCCPAEAAIDTVRLLEGIVRSATTNQVVRLS